MEREWTEQEPLNLVPVGSLGALGVLGVRDRYASREERKGRQGHCSVAPGVKKRVPMRSSTKAHKLLYEGAHVRF